MKKTILTATIALSLIFGFSASAQCPTEKAECAKTECKKECKKAEGECKKECKKTEGECKKECKKAEGECKKAEGECKKECKKAEGECKKGMRQGRHHGKHQRMFEGIELTDQQKEQLKQLRQECPEGKDLTPEQRKEAFEARKAEIKKILTPEQYAIFEKNVAKAHAQKFDGATRMERNGRKLGDGVKAEGRKLEKGAKALDKDAKKAIKAEAEKVK